MNFINKNKQGKYMIIKEINKKSLKDAVSYNLSLIEENGIVQLELKNTSLIMYALIKDYTNISDFYDIENNLNEVFESKDKDIKKILKKLKNEVLTELVIQRKELKNNFKKINKNIKEINKKLR